MFLPHRCAMLLLLAQRLGRAFDSRAVALSRASTGSLQSSASAIQRLLRHHSRVSAHVGTALGPGTKTLSCSMHAPSDLSGPAESCLGESALCPAEFYLGADDMYECS